MLTKIGTIGVAVSDQNKALDFYVNTLSSEKIDDQPMSETKRWLEVAPRGAQTHLMLGLRGQSSGDKTGFTGYVLHTDNIEETCQRLKAILVPVSGFFRTLRESKAIVGIRKTPQL
jgi:lactoylglutathione lyase